MTATTLNSRFNDNEVLTEALLAAGRGLGLTQVVIGEVVGRDRTSLKRPLEPASKAGQLALLLVRIYRSLFALVGGDPDHMQHWMFTANHHTGGVPAEQIRTPEGLVTVVSYLDAMRGR